MWTRRRFAVRESYQRGTSIIRSQDVRPTVARVSLFMAIAARFYRRGRLALVVLDVGLAGALTVGGLADVSALGASAPKPLAVVLCVVCASTVAWRRTAPVAAVLVSATALWTYEVATRDQRLTFLPYAVLFVYYLLGRRGTAG